MDAWRPTTRHRPRARHSSLAVARDAPLESAELRERGSIGVVGRPRWPTGDVADSTVVVSALGLSGHTGGNGLDRAVLSVIIEQVARPLGLLGSRVTSAGARRCSGDRPDHPVGAGT